MRPREATPVASLPNARLIGRRIVRYRRVVSTMDTASREAARGGPDGLVVVADEQTAGRGRHGRKWISAPGDDLLFSVALRPRRREAPRLSVLAGLAVSMAVDRMAPVSSTIKWPNDVRVKGLKIAGVLVETHVEGETARAVIGVGLNLKLDAALWPEIAGSATSMQAIADREVTRDHALETVLCEMDGLYARLLDGESITAEWAARLDTIGRDIEVRFAGETVAGRAESVDDAGGLVLRRPDGRTVTCSAGEVTLQTANQQEPGAGEAGGDGR